MASGVFLADVLHALVESTFVFICSTLEQSHSEKFSFPFDIQSSLENNTSTDVCGFNFEA